MARTRRPPTEPPADPTRAKKVQTGISIHAWHLARADELATSYGVTRSDLIAKAIDAIWDQRRTASALLENTSVRHAMLDAFSNPDIIKALISAHSPNSAPVDDTQLALFTKEALERLNKEHAR